MVNNPTLINTITIPTSLIVDNPGILEILLVLSGSTAKLAWNPSIAVEPKNKIVIIIQTIKDKAAKPTSTPKIIFLFTINYLKYKDYMYLINRALLKHTTILILIKFCIISNMPINWSKTIYLKRYKFHKNKKNVSLI